MNSENSDGLRKYPLAPKPSMSSRSRCESEDVTIRTSASLQRALARSFRKYVASLITWHVDVKEDEIRTGRRRVGVRLLEKHDRLLAVVGHVNLRVDP